MRYQRVAAVRGDSATVIRSADDRVTGHAEKLTKALGLSLALSLIVLYVWAGTAVVGYYDTYRDLYFAALISQGHAFPLAGPLVYNTIHLGPIWWYLLAAAAKLGGSLTAAHGFALAAAAVKYPLAWHLGRRLGGPVLALFAVAAVAMPGWSVLSVGALTHSSVVETTILLGAIVTLRYREQPTFVRAAWVGLVASLMIHAHPTALPAALAACLAAALRMPRSRVMPWHLLALVLAGTLPFVPYLWEQAQGGFPDFHALLGYADTTLGAPVLPRLLPVLGGVATWGPEYVWRYWLGSPEPLVSILFVIHATLLMLAALGAADIARQATHPHRRTLLISIGLFGIQAAFALVLRPITPFWMVYACLPPLAFALAIGLNALVDRVRATRASGLGTAVIVVAVLLWPISSLAALAGVAWHPNIVWVEVLEPGEQGLMDITERHDQRRRITVPRVGIGDIETLGPGCKPVRAYGHLAVLLDASFGVGLRVRCGKLRHISLGGVPTGDEPAWIGLTQSAWTAAGAHPSRVESGLGFFELRTVWSNAVALSIVTPEVYPPRAPNYAARHFVVTGTTHGDQRVVVTNRLDGYYPFEVVAIVDGVGMAPAYADNALQIFRPPSGSENASWTFRIHGSREAIDVAVLDASPTRH